MNDFKDLAIIFRDKELMKEVEKSCKKLEFVKFKQSKDFTRAYLNKSSSGSGSGSGKGSAAAVSPSLLQESFIANHHPELLHRQKELIHWMEDKKLNSSLLSSPPHHHHLPTPPVKGAERSLKITEDVGSDDGILLTDSDDEDGKRVYERHPRFRGRRGDEGDDGYGTDIGIFVHITSIAEDDNKQQQDGKKPSLLQKNQFTKEEIALLKSYFFPIMPKQKENTSSASFQLYELSSANMMESRLASLKSFADDTGEFER